MAENYILQVTAGSEYDVRKHQIVPVNQAKCIRIENELCEVDLNVRVQDYRGLPKASPNTSPYFDLPPHDKNKDQYSIGFRFKPKQDINAEDLVFGNDFDHPIRDRLPPGFSTAFRIVKWVVDPGLDGDVYADEPYLYGPAASSFNVLYVGDGGDGEGVGDEDAGLVFEEGGDEEGEDHRRECGIPEGEAARKKYFLTEANRREWDWEEGRTYGCDFFNAYLDFNSFSLKLPGFTMPIMKYWDGQGLRYVLKNRKTGEVLLVVLFTLYLKEDVDENGKLKDGVEGGKPFDQLPKVVAEKHLRERNGEGGDGGEKEVKVEKVDKVEISTNDDEDID
ncbi:hypothetical protein SBOR_1314 [Sclerotinia borealis F-4128]|uniref:Domain of unknown function at the cortex 1 domain-containing protein n=1 Tax=Sclerotinia borealis (strain F-4128) TaxID=1432307 RepID=W9CR61_SCLBF|nr:hypothetical protein SBOR_1314 [Sclerotinia borealis F-4128]